MRSKLDLTSIMKVTAAMMVCVLLYLQQERIAQSKGRWLRENLDGSYAYTLIPSISIGVRRAQLVELWRTLFHYVLSNEAKYRLIVQSHCSVSVARYEIQISRHVHGLVELDQISMKRNISSEMCGVNARIFIFTVLRRIFL